MAKPVMKAVTLITADGVPIEAVHLPGAGAAERTGPAGGSATGNGATGDGAVGGSLDGGTGTNGALGGGAGTHGALGGGAGTHGALGGGAPTNSASGKDLDGNAADGDPANGRAAAGATGALGGGASIGSATDKALAGNDNIGCRANGRAAAGTGRVSDGPAGDRAIGFVVAHGFTQSWQRPAVWHVAERLNQHGGVVTFDFRGHGRSGGAATLGDKEIYDVAAAAHYLRELGYQRVVTVGFSMGASVVLRQAGLLGGVDAVVSVSGPGRWYYRGTPAMRRVHWVIEHRLGRLLARHYLKTEIARDGWEVVPTPPADAAARIAPTPLLVVHGGRDAYFPADHAEQIFEAAHQPKELWVIPGLGHAEAAMTDALIDQIAQWAIAASAINGNGHARRQSAENTVA